METGEGPEEGEEAMDTWSCIHNSQREEHSGEPRLGGTKDGREEVSLQPV